MNLNKLGFSKDTRSLFFKVCFVVCVTMAGSLLQTDYSCAGGGGAKAKTPCDPEYMDALEARAWMEAQREIAQNQNLIYRPDSVMEMTCFDKFLNEAASNFGSKRQFSETSHWDGHPVSFSDTTTDDAIEAIVGEPLMKYMEANFYDNFGDYLNNRTKGKNHKKQGKVQGGDYTCAEMQEIWLLARCAHFIPPEEQKFDGFFDFKKYEEKTWDPRQESNDWALACKQGDSRFVDARKSAFNNDQDLFSAEDDEKPEGNGTPYKEDDVVTHLQHILPGSCNLCVPTGICVQRPDLGSPAGSPFQEKVCTNPGCPAPTNGGSCSTSGAGAP